MSCDGLIIRIFMTIIGCKGLFFFEVSMTPRQGARLDSHQHWYDHRCSMYGSIQSTPGSLAEKSRGAPISLISLPHFLLKNGPSYYIACSSPNRWNVNRARRILKSLLMVYGEKTCSYLWELKIQYSILYDWINLYLQSLLQIYKTYSLRICWKQIENVHITHLWKGIFNYTWHRLPLNRWPWIPWIFGIP